MTRKERVVKPDDPIGFDHHLLNMSAYWKYQKVLFRESLKGRLTLGTFIIILGDWLRFRILRLWF